MRYRNISLNDDKGAMYYLVKYSDEYRCKEREIKTYTPSLADTILTAPTTFSELSDHQGYMLLNENSELLGLVSIGTSTDEKDLELEVEFSEERLPSKRNKVNALYTLLDAIELYFNDKDNIEIRLHNEIDLSMVNLLKFSRMPYSEDYVTYRCKNSKKELISKLLEEIQYSNGERRNVKINYGPVDFSVDHELMEEVENGNVPLTELFSKVQSIKWTDMVDLSKNRTVLASRDGNMNVTEVTGYIGSYPESKYTYKYNLERPGFTLTGELFDGVDYTDVEIEDNRYYTKVSYDRMTFMKAKKSGRTKISYRGPVIGDTSIDFEAYGENDEIRKINIDIRNKKRSTGKTNGTYSLRFQSRYKECKWSLASLRYYNRSGLRSADYCKYLEENDPILIEDVIKNGFNGENVQQLINATVKIINGNINYFPNVYPIETPNFEDEYNKVTSIVSSIQENTPLPFLKEQLSTFSNSEVKKEKTEVVQKKKKF